MNWKKAGSCLLLAVALAVPAFAVRVAELRIDTRSAHSVTGSLGGASRAVEFEARSGDPMRALASIRVGGSRVDCDIDLREGRAHLDGHGARVSRCAAWR